MGDINRARRYYLLKRKAAEALSLWGTAGAWRSKQEAEPGTPLAVDFPHLESLIALGYSTEEDLDGADETELREAGLSRLEAEAVLAAME